MIVVATTLTTFAMSGGEDVWGSWLRHAEHIIESVDEPVVYFAAIETDARGLGMFGPLMDRLHELEADVFVYSLDDGRVQVTTGNRLRHITCGQNLCSDYAVAVGADHMLFLAADLEPDPDCLPKLLALDRPLVGGYVSTYCLTGDEGRVEVDGGVPVYVQRAADDPVATAAFMLLSREVFSRLKWRYDPFTGESDDPALQRDVWEVLGHATVVRRDCTGKHHPEAVPAIEGRGYDLTVVRS